MKVGWVSVGRSDEVDRRARGSEGLGRELVDLGGAKPG